MKNQVQFFEILKEMSLKNIHIDGFEPEQIFYQIEPLIESKFNDLEQEINTKHKKFLKVKTESNSIDNESSEMEENVNYTEGSHESEISKENSECSSNEDNDIRSGISGETIEYSSNEDEEVNESEMTEENQSSNCDHSNESENSHQFSEEQTVSFDQEVWEESHSSDTEFLNKPAAEVGYLLWGNKKKDNRKN